MTSETLYVWIHLPGAGQPVLAARAVRDRGSGAPAGRFIYRRQYLDDPAALAIDPVLLPLVGSEVTTISLTGHFSALLDAGPDAWGRRLIERRFGTQSEYGALLHLDGGQVGALSFTMNPDAAPDEHVTAAEFASMDALVATACAVETGGTIAPELEAWLAAGSSIGGARPKFLVRHEDALWIAKLESVNDSPTLNIPVLEAATLALARSCGIDVADFALHTIGKRRALLVRRFDRRWIDNTWQRSRYVSARTVFHANPDLQRHASSGSYPRLARELSRWCHAPREQKHQLFRRMVFNALTCNTDDHELNHGLVAEGRDFRLAPAFDLVPQPPTTRRRYQAMLVGTVEGALPSRRNLLSACEAFELAAREAGEIIDHMAERVEGNWAGCLRTAGAGKAMVEAARPMFGGLVEEE